MCRCRQQFRANKPRKCKRSFRLNNFKGAKAWLLSFLHIFKAAVCHYKSKRCYEMRLCYPPDGSTSPKNKLVCFITAKKICKEKNALAFNQDR